MYRYIHIYIYEEPQEDTDMKGLIEIHFTYKHLRYTFLMHRRLMKTLMHLYLLLSANELHGYCYKYKSLRKFPVDLRAFENTCC